MSGSLTSEELASLFKYAQRYPKPKRGDLTQLARGAGHARSTIARAFAVCSELVKRGSVTPLTNEQVRDITIQAGYGTTAGYVHSLFAAYIHWRLGGGIVMQDRLRGAHLDTLFDQLRKLKSCFENIDASGSRPDDRERLEIRGQDWRLEPMMWFYLCTPDIDALERWAPDFKSLLQHLKPSEIEKRLASIRMIAQDIRQRITQAVGRVEHDSKLVAINWPTVQSAWYKAEGEYGVRPRRTGGNPDVATDDWTPACSDLITDLMMSALEPTGPKRKEDSIVLRQLDIEDELRFLRDYLASKELGTIIARGHCAECPE